jgi:hypothetical protein
MSYILLGLILVALTPIITAAVKKYAINNKALSAVMPLILTAVVWLGDALLTGINPFSDPGMMDGLLVLLAGSLSGAKVRDVYKHLLKAA